jgi:hypothetical protein
MSLGSGAAAPRTRRPEHDPRNGYRFLEKVMLKPIPLSEMMIRRDFISL